MKNRQFVLVEGRDDEHVIKHLCGARMIPPVLKFEPFENVDELISAIPTRLKASLDGDVVAIVLDADASLANRWTSIRHHLLGLRYHTVTDEPNTSGTIIDPPNDTILPRLGIWIMPDNSLNGMLEDFLALLVPHERQSLFERVKNAVDGIPEPDRLFSNTHLSKVLLHTWLAWQEKPGLPYGTAITAKFLDPNCSEADVFVSWLKVLFRF